MNSSGILTGNLLLDSENIHPVQEQTSFQATFLWSGQNASKGFMGWLTLRHLPHLFLLRTRPWYTKQSGGSFWRKEMKLAETYLRDEVKKSNQDQTSSLKSIRLKLL